MLHPLAMVVPLWELSYFDFKPPWVFGAFLYKHQPGRCELATKAGSDCPVGSTDGSCEMRKEHPMGRNFGMCINLGEALLLFLTRSHDRQELALNLQHPLLSVHSPWCWIYRCVLPCLALALHCSDAGSPSVCVDFIG